MSVHYIGIIHKFRTTVTPLQMDGQLPILHSVVHIIRVSLKIAI